MNAVIFDFDGTIADSFDQVLEFLCKECGRDITTIGAAERAELRGLSMRQLAVKVGVPGWRLPLAFLRGKSKLTKQMHTMEPFAGIEEVLAGLHAENYKLYIISSNSRRNMTRFLSEHGLGGYFIKIYPNAGWLGKSGILKRAMANHGLRPETTIYVGDEARDLIAAKVAGMPSVAVSWGFGSEEQLLKYSPTILVRKPSELLKALTDWGRTS